MKKNYLSILLFPLLVLSSCSFNNEALSQIINKGIMDANTKEETKNIYHLDSLSTKEIEIKNVTNVRSQNGFVAYTHTDGSNSIYSLLTKKFLEIDYTNNFGINSYPSEIVGGYLLIQYSDHKTIVDALGNIITNDFTKDVTNIVDRYGPKGQYYAEIVSSDNIRYLYQYIEGVPTLVASLQGEEEIDYNPGSSFIGSNSVSLSSYGHVGYKMIRNNGRIVIFDASNNEVSSFYEPECNNEFMIGDYIIYQKSTLLDDYNDNYDYLDELGQRYVLDTNKINYLTGQISSVDVDYVFTSDVVKPFFNENGVYKYAYGNIQLISKKRILSSVKRTFLIDENGGLHDDVTGIYLDAFERISTSFYNNKNYTLYNENLSEISILSSDAKVMHNAGIIITSHNGLYGAINNKGKIVIPFIYKEIFTSYVAKNYLFARHDENIVSVFFDCDELRYQELNVYSGYSSISYIGGDAFMMKGENTADRLYGDYITLRSLSPENVQLDPNSEMVLTTVYCRLLSTGVQAILEFNNDGENKNMTSYQYSNIVIQTN